MDLRLLLALSGAAVIAGVAGCGTSGTAASSSSTSSEGAPQPAARGPSPCASLNGTPAPDKACGVHTETPTYTVDSRFPVTYPDMRPVTDYIAKRRDDFVDWLEKYPVPGGARSDFHIDGQSYESPQTRSLVLTIETEGGVHPVTTYKAFNYDVGDLAPLLTDSPAAPPCGNSEVTVAAEPPQAAVTHRAVTLTFGLAPGAVPCTLTGYPGVDTGAGGPLVHAQRLPRGYMGGLPEGVEQPPTVTLSSSTSAHAVIEGLAVDKNGDQCPTYTELRVTPPDTTETSTVATTIDACVLIVHPVT